MRVWIENPFDNLPGEGCRLGRYPMMARAFAAAGHKVAWWTSNFSHTRKAIRNLTSLDRSLSYDIRLVPTKEYRSNVSLRRISSHRAYATAWYRLARSSLGVGERPDLLIVSSPPLSTGSVARRICARTGAKLIVDIQDAWPETFYRLLPRALRFLGPHVFSRALAAARRLYASADLVTGVSERYRELALAAGAGDYRLLPLGIDAPGEVPRSTARPTALAYVGNLGRGYDLDCVIRAVARNESLTLDIAGAGPREGEFRRLAAKLECGTRIRFHSYLGNDDLRAMLSRCRYGVVPMRDESLVGVPNKVADYAAAGLGVLSSLGGECASVLKRFGIGETYEPGDAKSFADAYSRLVGRGALDTGALVESFNGERIYAEYVKMAEALVESGGRR